jgi:hypothetical protein
MRRGCRYLSSLLMAAVLFSPVALTGCAPRAYRVYDPYYHDYHTWNGHEAVFYQRWEGETRRAHQDLNRRRSDEQEEYFTWRHGRSD